MICLLTEETAHSVQSLKEDTVGIRILSNLGAYGCNRSFALFWRQTDENGKVTALIEKMDKHLSVVAKENADFEELSLFVQTMREPNGAVFSSLVTAKQMGIADVKVYHEMVIQNFSGIQNTTYSKTQETLSEVYSVLKAGEDGDISLPPFEAWYADFSHKTRHHHARAVIIHGSAVAVTSAELDDCAIISGVSVLPEGRGQGLGGAVVWELCHELTRENKAVYVVCGEDMTDFYEKLGFIHCGETAICN